MQRATGRKRTLLDQAGVATCGESPTREALNKRQKLPQRANRASAKTSTAQSPKEVPEDLNEWRVGEWRCRQVRLGARDPAGAANPAAAEAPAAAGTSLDPAVHTYGDFAGNDSCFDGTQAHSTGGAFQELGRDMRVNSSDPGVPAAVPCPSSDEDDLGVWRSVYKEVELRSVRAPAAVAAPARPAPKAHRHKPTSSSMPGVPAAVPAAMTRPSSQVAASETQGGSGN